MSIIARFIYHTRFPISTKWTNNIKKKAIINKVNTENVNIKFSPHDACLELPSSGTLKSQIYMSI
jgi:hypothetical protein